MRLSFLMLVSAILLPGVGHAQSIPTIGTWLEFADTKLEPVEPSVAELGTAWCNEIDGCPGGHFAWTGMSFDPGERILSLIRPGGHSDGGAGDSYCLDLDELADPLPPGVTTHWARCEPVQHLTVWTGQTKTINGVATPVCPWPTQGAPSHHTYDGVPFVGTRQYLYFGLDGACSNAVMSPNKMAWYVDTSTSPWTWTRHPELETWAGQTATAVVNGKIYVIEKGGKFAIIDAATLTVDRSGTMAAAKISGVTQPGFSSLNAQMSAMDCADSGICAAANQAGLALMDINGVQAGTTDLRFGKNIKHALPAGFVGNLASITAVPGGRFALWNGAAAVAILTPDFTTPANDVWQVYTPANGPSPQNAYTLARMFWDQSLCALVATSNRDENLWQFNPGVCEPEQTENSPPASTDFAARCAASGVIFCQDFDADIPRGLKLKEGVGLNGSSVGHETAVLPHVIDSAGNKVLRFDILNHSGAADAGQYFVDFGAMGHPIGPGERVYVQWRQFIPESLLHTTFPGTTFKMLILDISDTASCPAKQIHFTLVKGNWGELAPRGGIRAYMRCPSSENIDLPGIKINGSRRFDAQPIGQRYETSRQCWQDHREKCVEAVAGRWVTYQAAMAFASDGYWLSPTKFRYGTRISVWQDDALVIDTIVPVANVDQKLGRAWFLPYMTGKDTAQDHADTFTLIDDVIVSTERIADPV